MFPAPLGLGLPELTSRPSNEGCAESAKRSAGWVQVVHRARRGRVTGARRRWSASGAEGARASRRRGIAAHATACAAIKRLSRFLRGGKAERDRGTLPLDAGTGASGAMLVLCCGGIELAPPLPGWLAPRHAAHYAAGSWGRVGRMCLTGKGQRQTLNAMDTAMLRTAIRQVIRNRRAALI